MSFFRRPRTSCLTVLEISGPHISPNRKRELSSASAYINRSSGVAPTLKNLFHPRRRRGVSLGGGGQSNLYQKD